jgi:hypothetical protein
VCVSLRITERHDVPSMIGMLLPVAPEAGLAV